jgi:hypothetical protein
MMAGKKPVKESCPDTSDMKGACGAWCKAYSNVWHGAENSLSKLEFVIGIITNCESKKKQIHGGMLPDQGRTKSKTTSLVYRKYKRGVQHVRPFRLNLTRNPVWRYA